MWYPREGLHADVNQRDHFQFKLRVGYKRREKCASSLGTVYLPWIVNW